MGGVRQDDIEEAARNCPNTVIASQRVRAKRGPMTGSAKQSRLSRGTRLDALTQGLNDEEKAEFWP
jgi:hypothetical protein